MQMEHFTHSLNFMMRTFHFRIALLGFSSCFKSWEFISLFGFAAVQLPPVVVVILQNEQLWAFSSLWQYFNSSSFPPSASCFSSSSFLSFLSSHRKKPCRTNKNNLANFLLHFAVRNFIISSCCCCSGCVSHRKKQSRSVKLSKKCGVKRVGECVWRFESSLWGGAMRCRIRTTSTAWRASASAWTFVGDSRPQERTEKVQLLDSLEIIKQLPKPT